MKKIIITIEDDDEVKVVSSSDVEPEIAPLHSKISELVYLHSCPYCGNSNITQFGESEAESGFYETHCPDCGKKVLISERFSYE